MAFTKKKMGILLLALLIISSSFLSKAECYYSAFDLKLEIEVNGTRVNYYRSLSACDFNPDSARSPDYLLAVLSDSLGSSTISVFEQRISYSYCVETVTSCTENGKDTIFKLLNRSTLSRSEVTKISVLECRKTSSMIHISNVLELSDIHWLGQKPIKAINLEFDLCNNQIFVHRQNKAVDQLLSNIEAFQLKINTLDGIELSPTEERKYYREMESLTDRIGAEEQVVVITECTD